VWLPLAADPAAVANEKDGKRASGAGSSQRTAMAKSARRWTRALDVARTCS